MKRKWRNWRCWFGFHDLRLLAFNKQTGMVLYRCQRTGPKGWPCWFNHAEVDFLDEADTTPPAHAAPTRPTHEAERAAKAFDGQGTRGDPGVSLRP